MKVGIIGLPGTGKTTLFHALTRGEGSAVGGGTSALIGVVPVPDQRFDFAVELFHPKKRTPASIEFLDGAAQIGAGGAGQGRKFGSDFFVGIRSVDALVQVVRAFDSPAAIEPPDPLREAAAISEELLLADLQTLDNRLERIGKQLSSRKAGAVAPELIERDILLRLKDALDELRPIRSVELTEEERRIIRNFDFLTGKPIIVVANLSEADIGRAESLERIRPLQEWCRAEGAPLIALCAAVEQEIAQLPEGEQSEYLAAMGIAEPARNRLIRAAYQALGLMSFFTVGEDEVRAWTIPIGSNALTAAGRIHSDLARGFIRAEVMAFDDLLASGTWEAAKAANKLRLEGREYVAQDGDILHVRFKV